jgi:hypothetical protein
MLSNSPDDDETARYLASFIYDNLPSDMFGPILKGPDQLYELIKEFYETLP